MPELKFPNQEPDFEAELYDLSPKEGGSKNSPWNGVRWDFKYREDDISDGSYIIHPYFIDNRGELTSQFVPLSGNLRAWMYIMFDEMRVPMR